MHDEGLQHQPLFLLLQLLLVLQLSASLNLGAVVSFSSLVTGGCFQHLRLRAQAVSPHP